MRQLLPRRLYPGWRRVGQPRAQVTYRPEVRVSAGVNWWWGRSMARALRFLAAGRPEVIVLQWWTAAVGCTATCCWPWRAGWPARASSWSCTNCRTPGKDGSRRSAGYGQWGLRLLLRLCHGCVVHSAADRDALRARHQARGSPAGDRAARPVRPVPAGHRAGPRRPAVRPCGAVRPGVVSLLFFGTIRPYKGLEDLLRVFNGLAAARGGRPAADGDRRDLGRLHGARPVSSRPARTGTGSPSSTTMSPTTLCAPRSARPTWSCCRTAVRPAAARCTWR